MADVIENEVNEDVAVKESEEAIKKLQALEELKELEEKRKTVKGFKAVEAGLKETKAYSKPDERQRKLEEWIPKTKAGKLVKNNQVASLDDLYAQNLAVIEPEIVDALIPDLEELTIAFDKNTRVTKSGRNFSFRATVLVGNRNGYIGIGTGKDKEKFPAIRKAARSAKLNIVKVRMGCGSWECADNAGHSVPFKIKGKEGSVRVTLLPAPRGVGLAVAPVIRPVLELAGVKDVWVYTEGKSRTSLNFVKATLNALQRTSKMKLSSEMERKFVGETHVGHY